MIGPLTVRLATRAAPLLVAFLHNLHKVNHGIIDCFSASCYLQMVCDNKRLQNFFSRYSFTIRAVATISALPIAPACLFAQSPPLRPAAAKFDPAAAYTQKIVPFLKQHCYDCHGPDVQEAE